MNQLGTILPDYQQLAEHDYFENQEKIAKIAIADKKYSGFKKQIVCGEIRYYYDSLTYVTINNKWFEIRQDGDYAISPKI